MDSEGGNDGGDYEVGYGKPPKATRFKPGQSGNPRGPKKGSRGLKKDLHKALSHKQSIKINGKIIKGTTQELALHTLATRAAAGDIRATRQLIDLTLQVFGAEDRGRERATLSQHDQLLLERLLARSGAGNVDTVAETSGDVGADEAPADSGPDECGADKSEEDDNV